MDPVYFALLAMFDFQQRHGRWAAAEDADQWIHEATASAAASGLGLNEPLLRYGAASCVCVSAQTRSSGLLDKRPQCRRDLAVCSDTELPAVCAVVGGMLAQEVLKVVRHCDRLLQNFFFFNAITGTGTVESIT